MSKFHSTVSRRDFIKGIGLVGAGAAATAGAIPVFHDMDEVVSSPQSGWKRPWWVSEVDEPTCEIDWSQVQRIDNSTGQPLTNPMLVQGYLRGYVTQPGGGVTSQSQEVVDFMKSFKATTKTYINEKYPEWSGDTLRDLTLYDTSVALQFGPLSQPYNPTGFRSIPTPEARGVPKWSATPEENMRMLRTVGRLVGLRNVICIELDDKTLKFFFSKSRRGKDVVFDDVDDYLENDTSTIYPNSCKWMIQMISQEPNQLMSRSPAGPGIASHKFGASRGQTGRAVLQEFLHGLGYKGLDFPAIDNPLAMMGGVGEKGRMPFPILSPEYGVAAAIYHIITDLPLAPAKPIDAGLARFCLSCKICSDMCPWDAIPKGEPSWEPDWTPPINYTAPGFKGWRLNTNTCNYCTGCQGVCPFNALDYASAHTLVRATAATTPIFNSFFANMERFFGYGLKNPETWWDMEHRTLDIDEHYLG
jgi:reductive dehalogenase